jgi:hypothetical protein
MKALAILRPPAGTDPREAVMQRAGEELRALWDLYRGGFVREMYSPGGLGAILVLETQSLEDAAERLARLPVLAEAIMTLELLEMRPFGALQMLFRA